MYIAFVVLAIMLTCTARLNGCVYNVMISFILLCLNLRQHRRHVMYKFMFYIENKIFWTLTVNVMGIDYISITLFGLID